MGRNVVQVTGIYCAPKGHTYRRHPKPFSQKTKYKKGIQNILARKDIEDNLTITVLDNAFMEMASDIDFSRVFRILCSEYVTLEDDFKEWFSLRYPNIDLLTWETSLGRYR